jgi:hypothetical protein
MPLIRSANRVIESGSAPWRELLTASMRAIWSRKRKRLSSKRLRAFFFFYGFSATTFTQLNPTS